MRNAASALLIVAYAFAAAFAAAFAWLTSQGWAPAVGLGLAVFAAAVGIHGLVFRPQDPAKLKRDLASVRDANRLLAEVVEGHDEAISDLRARLEFETERRTEALTSEVRVLEQLIERMGDTLEDRIAAWRDRAPAESLFEQRQVDNRAALLETVRDALAHNRVDLYLQPVVSLPQRRTVFYESFSRLRDESGRVMMPAEYLAVAEPEGLVTAIDNLLLFRCVQIVRRLAKQDRKIGIFCNISLASLGDESFFPQFLEFLAENKDMAGAVIFELGQGAFARRGSVEARNMAKLADLGFRFSLDKVTTLELDFLDLQRSDVKHLKVSAPTLLEQLVEDDGRLALRTLKDIQASDFASLARRYGVELIAEKVETEREVIDVLELDIAYGQGHLFGEPRAIRDAVLAEADPPADFMLRAGRGLRAAVR
jgi:cyclic-di-GMP phosphodiesterase TipF (flagellum assembly factor)